MQHSYNDKFTDLERSGNMMLSLTDINARLVSIWIGIHSHTNSCRQILHAVRNVNYHTMYLLLLHPSNHREVLKHQERYYTTSIVSITE